MVPLRSLLRYLRIGTRNERRFGLDRWSPFAKRSGDVASHVHKIYQEAHTALHCIPEEGSTRHTEHNNRNGQFRKVRSLQQTFFLLARACKYSKRFQPPSQTARPTLDSRGRRIAGPQRNNHFPRWTPLTPLSTKRGTAKALLKAALSRWRWNESKKRPVSHSRPKPSKQGPSCSKFFP